jgi:hypothetical protein
VSMGLLEAEERPHKAARIMTMSGPLAWARQLCRGLLPEPQRASIPWFRKEKLSLHASFYLILILSLALWAMIGAGIAQLVQISL